MSYAKFDDLAASQIGYYVYALCDPRDKKIFYVGKGKGNRWYDHIHHAQSLGEIDANSLKLSKIKEIELAGLEVEPFIIRMGISSEKVAYEIEAAVIHAYRLLTKAGNNEGVELTNLAEVHNPERGLAHVSIVQSLYNAPRAPEITDPAVLLRLPKLWYPEISQNDLREITSGWWHRNHVLNGKRKARYAFAVSRGIVRAVYSINESMWRERQPEDRDWQDDIGKSPRWGFPDCEIAPEMSHFLNTSVKHLFKPGHQSPAVFVNCK